MKKNRILLASFLVILLALGGCKDDDKDINYATISTGDIPSEIATINENDVLKIPLKVTSDAGIKRATYFLVKKEGDKLVPGDAIALPVDGNAIDTELDINVDLNLYSVIISIIDGNNNISKQEIALKNVRELAKISFKNGVDLRKKACIGIPFAINGSVSSKYDLTKISYKSVVNGVAQTSSPITVSNPRNMDFSISVPVVAGLSEVLISAENSYGGVRVDTFKVEEVVSDDFITLTMDGNITQLTSFYDAVDNIISGNIASASDIISLKYAITQSGTEGALQTVTLDGDISNETEFNFTIRGSLNMEKVKLVAENSGGKTTTLVLTIPKVLIEATVFKNVIMTSDPQGNNCFFSAYMEPHVFGRTVALANQSKVDWVLYKTGAGAQTLSPHAYKASAAITTNSTPYLTGFSDLTYLLLTSRRGNITKVDFDGVISEDDLLSLTTNPAKNGYGVTTPGTGIVIANRRIGDTFTPTSVQGAFILGWGARSEESVSPAYIQNKSYGIGWVNSVTLLSNGHIELNFDLKVPRANQRSLYNSESMVTYTTPIQ